MNDYPQYTMFGAQWRAMKAAVADWYMELEASGQDPSIMQEVL